MIHAHAKNAKIGTKIVTATEINRFFYSKIINSASIHNTIMESCFMTPKKEADLT